MFLSFKQRVLVIVQSIPSGSTMSYKEVAMRAGSPGAARAVGTIMKQNRDPLVPCHRVICSDGSIGGYNRGVDKKRKLLEFEKKEADIFRGISLNSSSED
jgi:O-6-methylguanine DNA methyltransferase